MAETPTLFDVYVKLKGGANPVWIREQSESEALRLRDVLTTGSSAGWVDIANKGKQYRISTEEVAVVTIEQAWVQPEPALANNIIVREDGSYVADGSDPQIPLGTPVGRDGTPLETYNGEFS